MTEQTLDLVKIRLNRLDSTLDTYLISRIESAIREMDGIGIHLEETTRDIIFLCDYVCWQYSNRDKSESMPAWLRLARRERLLAETSGKGGECDD